MDDHAEELDGAAGKGAGLGVVAEAQALAVRDDGVALAHGGDEAGGCVQLVVEVGGGGHAKAAVVGA